jgi:hypothetical protein
MNSPRFSFRLQDWLFDENPAKGDVGFLETSEESMVAPAPRKGRYVARELSPKPVALA